MTGNIKNPLTAQELAQRLGATKQHIYKMAQLNKIPHYRLGNHIRFPSDVIEKHILKGTDYENEV